MLIYRRFQIKTDSEKLTLIIPAPSSVAQVKLDDLTLPEGKRSLFLNCKLIGIGKNVHNFNCNCIKPLVRKSYSGFTVK